MKDFIKKIVLFLYTFSISLTTFKIMKFDDVYFDLKTGEYIFKHGIDLMDHFSSYTGLKYLYHHWLYDCIIYVIHLIGGNILLYIFFYLLTTIIFLLLYKMYSSVIKNKILSYILAFINIIFMALFIANRVQMVTYICFLCEFLLIEKLYETGKGKYGWFIVVISILIANLHMTLWLLTVILLLPYVANIVLNNLKKDKILEYKCKDCRRFIFFFVLVIASGLVSINGPIIYYFPFLTLGTFDYSNITEMMKTSLNENRVFLFLYALSFGIMLLKNFKVRWSEVFMIFGLLIMGIMSFRNLSYVYLFVPYFIIRILVRNYNLKFKSLKIFNNKVIVNVIFIMLSIMSCLNISSFNFNGFKTNSSYLDSVIDFIKTNYDYKNIKMYNTYFAGSYLLYNDIPVSFDSRQEVYVSKINGGYPIATDYNSLTTYAFVEKYNLTFVLLDNENEDVNIFGNSYEWNVVYKDDYVILFEKNDNTCHLKKESSYEKSSCSLVA